MNMAKNNEKTDIDRRGWNKTDARGWNITHHYEAHFTDTPNPKRQGCRWTPNEDHDLLEGAKHLTVEALAVLHERSTNSVGGRLFSGRAAKGASLLMEERM